MSSDPSIRRHAALHRALVSRAAVAMLVAAALLANACGHKKAPQPPPSKIPQRVVLKVHQRGGEAVLSFPYPTTTISGTALPGISQIEIWRYAQEVPEFAIDLLAEEAERRQEAQALLDELGLELYEAPPPAEPVASEPPIQSEPAEVEQGEAEDGDGEESELTEEQELEIRIEAARILLRSRPTDKSSFITATKKDFEKDSELALTIEHDDISSALIGNAIVLRLTLPPRTAEGPEIGYLFAARVRALNGKPSDLSATIALLPSDTPVPPQEAAVNARPDGVHVSWSAAEDPPAGFRVYRREAQARIYGEPVGTILGTFRLFVDRQAIFGARYIYAVTALETLTPLLESDISSEHEIDYQDRFGPATPGGLVAFPEIGRVRLLWTSVTDVDLAGYEILRRSTADDVAAAVNSELISRGQYLDESVASGDSWLYSVVAIDESGNRSVVSAEIEVRVP